MLIFKEYFTSSSFISLGIIFGGAVLYIIGDNSFDITGISMVIFTLAMSITSPLFEKELNKRLSDEQNPIGIQFYRSSVIFCVLLMGYVFNPTIFLTAISKTRQLSLRVLGILLASCIASFLLGSCIFFLQKRVTVTTVVTALTCYKLIAMLISLILWPINITLFGILGIISSFAGVLLYTYTKTKSHGIVIKK